MMKWSKVVLFVCLLVVGLLVTGCGTEATPLLTATPFSIMPSEPLDLPSLPGDFPRVDRYPSPLPLVCEPKTAPGVYDPNSYDAFFGVWQMDYRSCDVSALNLKRSLPDLQFSTFDTKTIWPSADKLPAEFDPLQVLEMGKLAGPGLGELHRFGITGQGVGIALIDHTLLADHESIVEQLRVYDEAEDMPEEWPDLLTFGPTRGTALASLLVGKDVGVAPGADLYYFGIPDCTDQSDRVDYGCLAKGLEKMGALNQELPDGRKIRIVIIPLDFRAGDTGYDLVSPLVKEAKDAGMMVLFPSTAQFKYLGMGRSPLADPNRYESYGPSMMEEKGYFDTVTGRFSDRLYFPMDSHVVATSTGQQDYFLWRQGDRSETLAYLGAAYALALQVRPDLTPDDFWTLALETGTDVKIEYKGKIYTFGPIADMPALIQALQEGQ